MLQLLFDDFELVLHMDKWCFINKKQYFSFFKKKVENFISTEIISDFDNCIKIKIYSSIHDQYKDYIKKLLIRNDLIAFFRAHSSSKMLCSRSTTKKYCEERIIAYAKPLLKLARSLFSGEIYFNKDFGLKVNYFSLNPNDISRTIQNLVNFDNINETIHLDLSPKNEAFDGNSFLILTFCIIRGINGYYEHK